MEKSGPSGQKSLKRSHLPLVSQFWKERPIPDAMAGKGPELVQPFETFLSRIASDDRTRYRADGSSGDT
ncbi:hypothetical protein J2Z31_000623 [Sinorhizobium kostiense]|uniref:Uncharacterized protein n=1 Tax=Sinorhizobium kostiense TaxID=76747 RepID=A0ABS4QU03_9HYPH|nr:hypothetical protein [Sinorhizobium kostiense]